MKPLQVRLFSSIFIFAGAVFAFFGINLLLEGKASERWPAVSGTVLSSTVESKFSQDQRSNSRTSQSTTYHPKVTYEYRVDGQKHSSDQLGLSAWGSSNTDHALSVVAKYPVGSSVTVHYNPEHPAKSVLEPGVATAGEVATGLGAASFVVGCIMFFGLAHAFEH